MFIHSLFNNTSTLPSAYLTNYLKYLKYPKHEIIQSSKQEYLDKSKQRKRKLPIEIDCRIDTASNKANT